MEVKQNASFDSSFWINAHRAGLLEQVLYRYQLWYTPAVANELHAGYPSGREFSRLAETGLISQAGPAPDQFREFGPGERAAIDLVLGHRDWVLFMDDQRPFRAALDLGLQVVCSPALTVALFTQAKLTAEQTLRILARLAALQTVSPVLIAAALSQLGRTMEAERGI